jgi:hypothetical protein
LIWTGIRTLRAVGPPSAIIQGKTPSRSQLRDPNLRRSTACRARWAGGRPVLVTSLA